MRASTPPLHPSTEACVARKTRLAATWIALAVIVLVAAGCSVFQRSGPAGGARATDGTSQATPPSDSSPAPAPAAASARGPATRIGIATGDMRETDYQIGRDLATFVAPDADIALDVLATKGSADNLHQLTEDRRVELAIAQYDVVQAFAHEAANGNAEAARIMRSLRVVTPLYTQEMYFVVRRDAPMKSIDDIRGKRINLGLRGSGSALTAANLYRRMFQTPIAPRDAQYESDDKALAALTIAKTVDVVVFVAAQPAKLFKDMKSEAGNYIRLLALDPRSPGSREALKTYLPATILARNYGWLPTDVPTLSVMSFLFVSSRDNALTPHLASFARSLCTHLSALQTQGHPKWREVEIGRQLVPQWAHDPVSAAQFSRCPPA